MCKKRCFRLCAFLYSALSRFSNTSFKFLQTSSPEHRIAAFSVPTKAPPITSPPSCPVLLRFPCKHIMSGVRTQHFFLLPGFASGDLGNAGCSVDEMIECQPLPLRTSRPSPFNILLPALTLMPEPGFLKNL